jgi:hypothetical protein
MTLEALLKVIAPKAGKNITVNLLGEDNLLKITFQHPGFGCLDESVLESEVVRIDVQTLSVWNITIASTPTVIGG